MPGNYYMSTEKRQQVRRYQDSKLDMHALRRLAKEAAQHASRPTTSEVEERPVYRDVTMRVDVPAKKFDLDWGTLFGSSLVASFILAVVVGGWAHDATNGKVRTPAGWDFSHEAVAWGILLGCAPTWGLLLLWIWDASRPGRIESRSKRELIGSETVSLGRAYWNLGRSYENSTKSEYGKTREERLQRYWLGVDDAGKLTTWCRESTDVFVDGKFSYTETTTHQHDTLESEVLAFDFDIYYAKQVWSLGDANLLTADQAKRLRSTFKGEAMVKALTNLRSE